MAAVRDGGGSRMVHDGCRSRKVQDNNNFYIKKGLVCLLKCKTDNKDINLTSPCLLCKWCIKPVFCSENKKK